MLTADLIRPRVRVRGKNIDTQPLLVSDAHILNTANDLLRIMTNHVGQPRHKLDDALEEYEGTRLDYPVIRGLAKILRDVAVFANEPPLNPVELRKTLFGLSAERGPIVSQPDLLHLPLREALLSEVAEQLGLSAAEVEQALYADLQEEQILAQAGPGWSAPELIGRYNLELARGLLYWASELRITVRGGYQTLFKYLKLFKLMHTIRSLPMGGYAATIDGPISPFVASTLRYGFQMAKFLPGLMLCPGWTLEADIHAPGRQTEENLLDQESQPALIYRLDHHNALRSHYTANPEYDSRLEADFAAEFKTKFGEVRCKWKLAREDEIIPIGDTVMIPDFSFTNIKDGRRALVEIAGFWHPEYLRRKAWKLRQAGRTDLIVLAYESVNTTAETWANVPGEVLLFKAKPVIRDVLAAVERCAV